MPVQAGHRLGPYQLAELIGRGGTAELEDGQVGAEWSPDGTWIAYNWAKPDGVEAAAP
jgi:hypothetical protein